LVFSEYYLLAAAIITV